MPQYVGSNNNIVDVEADETGLSVKVWGPWTGTPEDVAVPLTGIPELVEVLLDAPETVPAVVRFAGMFDRDPDDGLAPAAGLLGMVQAYLRSLDQRRDYECWDGGDCETVAEILGDIAQFADIIRKRLG